MPEPESAEAARSQHGRLEEIAAQMRLHERSLANQADAQRLQARTLAELDGALETLSIRERLGDAWTATGDAWRYELFAVDDSPITVGRVTIGAFLLIVGLLFSGFLSRVFGRRLLPRLGFEPGAAAAIESLLYYAFVVGLVLLALRTVNVPLTAFTLLGGAAAIGLGFGSQNVISNFISGLILFAERPIRVGDMIEIDGTYGGVESIGARCTRVRSFTGIHIIVPNSAFLEKNVINWTLSDDRVRTHVSVGVAYGSPVEDVFRLIRQAVDEQPGVLRAPEPVVLFSEFGNDALLFEVHFWIRMRTQMDRRRMESDVRRALDQLFREAQIVIAFPQRDVHLDTSGPLAVRVVPDSGSE
jgi:small-conductance mechanosensitive channel